jgi:hypothetical protein
VVRFAAGGRCTEWATDAVWAAGLVVLVDGAAPGLLLVPRRTSGRFDLAEVVWAKAPLERTSVAAKLNTKLRIPDLIVVFMPQLPLSETDS